MLTDEQIEYGKTNINKSVLDYIRHLEKKIDSLYDEKNNLASFNQFSKPYVIEGQLSKKITDLITEYEGKISLVAVCGILDIIKYSIILDQKKSKEIK